MKNKKTVKCQWFFNCSAPAKTTQNHPILGKVPICEKCKAWYKRMGKQI